MKKITPEKKIFSVDNAKIGLLGGTFDPPHLAHIHMAQAAEDKLGLDFVVFMPLGVPPHGKTEISDARHRLAMLKIILSDYDDFYIDTAEAYMSKPSYTADSMERINGLLGKNTAVYFIIGADSLMYLDKWYDADRLFKITDFAVIPREGYDDDACKEHIRMLENRYGARIAYIDTIKLDYSSTEIRENSGTEDLTVTTEEIYKYIKENNLYG